MAKRFENAVVLITGAASGFGAAAARHFHNEGAKLVLTDIDAAVDEVAKECGAISLIGDIAAEATSQAMVERAIAAHGQLDIAVNNAGIGHALVPLPDIPADDFARVMAVNVGGVFFGMKHQLPLMTAAGAGAIVNVASAAGLMGAAQLSAYAASKHAVVGLTRSAALEAAMTGVRINAVCPAFADTPLFGGMAAQMSARHGIPAKDAGNRIASRVPMRRVADTDEIVQAIIWLADPSNSFTTGQAIAVDGGLSAG